VKSSSHALSFLAPVIFFPCSQAVVMFAKRVGGCAMEAIDPQMPPSRQSRDSPVIAPQWPPRSIDPARQHGSTESSHGGIAPRSRTMSLCRYSRTASTVYTVTNSFCDSWCKTRNSLNSIRHQAAVLGASPFFLSPVHQRRQDWLLDNFQASISCEVTEFRRSECFHPGEDYARAVLCAHLCLSFHQDALELS
jgi:hypothetical protein